MGNFGLSNTYRKPWTKEEIWEALACGPHQFALSPKALAHFADEAVEKDRTRQAHIVLWGDIKDNPLEQLKISPIAAILHKSKAFRSMLDLSFRLQLKNGEILASVNDGILHMCCHNLRANR